MKSDLSRLDRTYHATHLALAMVAIGLSFVFSLNPRGEVTVGGEKRLSLPGVCLSHELFHVPCPGCGLTRSFVCIAHGAWNEAWRFHRVGFALFLLLAMQIPFRAWMLCRRPCLTKGEDRLLQWMARLLVVMLVANWLWNAVFGWPPGLV